MGLKQPAAARWTKARYESAAATEGECINTFVQVKIALHEGFDIILQECNEHFYSEGLKLAVNREVTRQALSWDHANLQLPPSFNLEKLKMQLT